MADNNIAVSLISAASALTGASLSGLFNWLNNRAEHNRQRVARHRETRREVYAEFLRRAERAANKAATMGHAAQQRDSYNLAATEFLSAYNELNETHFLIRLEGPNRV